MRGVILLWLMFASPIIYCGCGGPRIDVPEPGTYSPLVAVSLGVAATETTPSPGPTPTPDSGKCENCNGTGRLGDGTVSVPCPVCGGDGRTDKHETNTVPAMPPLTKAALPKVTPADVDVMFDSLKRDPIPTTSKVARSDKVGIPPPALRDAAPAAGPAESYSAPRRGLFRGRLRGG